MVCRRLLAKLVSIQSCGPQIPKAFVIISKLINGQVLVGKALPQAFAMHAFTTQVAASRKTLQSKKQKVRLRELNKSQRSGGDSRTRQALAAMLWRETLLLWKTRLMSPRNEAANPAPASHFACLNCYTRIEVVYWRRMCDPVTPLRALRCG